ncbi:hypothetical protein ACX80Z_06195 [Arthrobacter sp. TMT4-20]
MKPGTGVRRKLVGCVVALLLIAPTLSTAAVAAPPGGTQLSELRYYQAAVNLFPETDGAYAGAVSFRQDVKGEATVDVFLSRAATISCPDLSEDIATTTIQTEGRGSREPGPVELDIGHSLEEALGHAVVDLTVTDSPGCGEPESVSVLPAQDVQITVTGTTPEPTGGLGVLFEDAIVQASTTSPPERATTVSASSLTVELVDCGDGTTAIREQFVVGSGPGVLTIGRKLGTATASGSIQFDRFVSDGCQGGEPVTDTVVLPVDLNLAASAPLVRVSDTRWQIRPGEGAERTKGWYLGREATGTVAVGAVAGTTNLAAIGSSGP